MTPEIKQFTNLGMRQDNSISKSSNEFAFENYNIRITSVNDNTLLSITNEKLPSPLPVNIKRKRVPNKVTLKEVTFRNNIYYRFILEKAADSDIRITYSYPDGKISSIFITNGSIQSNAFSPENSIVYYRVDNFKDDTWYSYYTPYMTIEVQDAFTDKIVGTYLGHSIINNKLVLFTKENSLEFPDFIYSLEIKDDSIIGEVKYRGSLNFSLNHPIETLSYYESEKVQKVYWVDGYNQPRVINIASEDIKKRYDTQFDFNPSVVKFPKVTITKEYQGIGSFPTGVIQYFISYYNKHGAETGIIWASDLNYISYIDRAGDASDNILCNFKLDISNIDTTYDYIRVYSLERTSLNTTPICKIVKDININNSESISVIDTNTNSETIDDTMLLFLGGDNFIASTLTQKDDVLFLGNLEVKNTIIHKDVLDIFEKHKDDTFVKFDVKTLSSNNKQLNLSEKEIKTFKTGELYRFAIQFQSSNGKWTTPLYIGSAKHEIYPSQNDDGSYNVAKAYVNFTDDIKNIIQNYYVNYRLLVAESTPYDRTVLAQGIINPTVFNYYYRIKGTGPYAQASWNLRPRNGIVAYEHLDELGNVKNKSDNFIINLPTCEIQNSINKIPVKHGDIAYNSYLLSISRIRNGYSIGIVLVSNNEDISFDEVLNEDCILFKQITTSDVSYAVDYFIDKIFEYLNIKEGDLTIDRTTLEEYFTKLPTATTDPEINNEYWEKGILYAYPNPIIKENTISGYINHGGLYSVIEIQSDIDDSNKYIDNFYVDTSIVSFHSPDLEGSEQVFDNANLKFRMVGVVPVEAESELEVTIENPTLNRNIPYTYLKYNKPFTNMASYSDASWRDYNLKEGISGNYYIYNWHKSGSIIGQTVNSTRIEPTSKEEVPLTTTYAKLKRKYSGTKYFSEDTKYLYYQNYTSDIITSVFNSSNIETKLFNSIYGKKTYQGNFESVVTTGKHYVGDNTYNVYYKDYDDKIVRVTNQVDPVSIKYKISPHLIFEMSTIGEDNVTKSLLCMPSLSKTEKDFPNNVEVTYKLDFSNEPIRYPWIKNSNNSSYIKQKTTEVK